MEKKDKEFKIGEKVYLSFDNGTVNGITEGYTIIGKESRYYIEDGNHRVYYELLHLQPDNKNLADSWTEDYTLLKEGLSEEDDRVIKYKKEHKQIETIPMEDACEYIEGLIDFLNMNGHQFKTKFIVDNFRKAMEEKVIPINLY